LAPDTGLEHLSATSYRFEERECLRSAGTPRSRASRPASEIECVAHLDAATLQNWKTVTWAASDRSRIGLLLGGLSIDIRRETA